jgi:hypothetical protein
MYLKSSILHRFNRHTSSSIPHKKSDNLKVYLTGQDPGIDCTSVMDDMFAEERGKKFTYTYRGGDGVEKIAHPQEYPPLSTQLTSRFERKKLTIEPGEHYEELWEAATDFSHLWALNRKFLLGEIPETPYHAGPIDDETIPLVEGLLKLHDFRLLTDGSQPYEHQHAFRLGEEWAEYQQRPYVTFTMPGEDGQGLEFFKRLKKRPEIVVQASELHPFRVLPGSHEQVVVSRERIAKTAEDLETTPWKGVTWALSGSGGDLFWLDAMNRSSLLYFAIAASEWGVSLDLLGVIEEVAVECDLPRIS